MSSWRGGQSADTPACAATSFFRSPMVSSSLLERESEQANSAEARGDALALDTNLLALKEASAGVHRRESERAHEAVVEHHLNLETASAHHAARQDGGRRTIGKTRER